MLVRMTDYKKCFVLLFIILSSFFAGCSGVSRDIGLAVCGSYSVPGMFCADLKGGSFSCHILEQDSFGRTLYQYEAWDSITEQTENALIVCQAQDDMYVYFYEDICYSLEPIDRIDLESFKKHNDWECPLDYSKTAKRPCSVSFDLYINSGARLDSTKLAAVFCKAMSIDLTQLDSVVFLDCDLIGHELYLVRVINNEESSQFLLISDRKYNIAMMKIINKAIIPSDISQFKQQNHWGQGDRGQGDGSVS